MDLSIAGALVLLTHLASIGQDPTQSNITTVHSQRPIEATTGELVPIRTVGQRFGPLEQTLSRVTAFVELPGGEGVVVADDSGLRRFDAEGRVFNIASVGPGPREVRTVSVLAVGQGNAVYVLDPISRRVSWFAADTLVGGFRVPDNVPTRGLHKLVVLPGPRLAINLAPDLPNDGSPVARVRPIFVVLSLDGEIVDTVSTPPSAAERCTYDTSLHWRRGYREDLRAPYFPKLTWDLGSDGTLLIGCPSDYTFHVMGPAGRLLRVSRTYDPVQVSRAEARSFVEAETVARRLTNPGWRWQGDGPPGVRPAYQDILLGDHGRVWVRPSLPRSEEPATEEQLAFGLPTSIWPEEKGGHFDVFDRSGQFIGSVRLPASIRYSPYPNAPKLKIRGDTLWALTRDDLGVETITQFKVDWAGAGVDLDES